MLNRIRPAYIIMNVLDVIDRPEKFLVDIKGKVLDSNYLEKDTIYCAPVISAPYVGMARGAQVRLIYYTTEHEIWDLRNKIPMSFSDVGIKYEMMVYRDGKFSWEILYEDSGL